MGKLTTGSPILDGAIAIIVSGGVLALLQLLWAKAHDWGAMVATTSPWVLIALSAVIFGVSVGFASAKNRDASRTTATIEGLEADLGRERLKGVGLSLQLQESAASLEQSEGDRKDALTEREAALSKAAEWERRATPTRLRAAARLLAKEIRDFADECKDVTEASGVISREFFSRFRSQYQKIKDRMESELAGASTKSWASVFPNTIGRLREIADDLDSDARRVAEDALL
jgi:hypothetical protein